MAPVEVGDVLARLVDGLLHGARRIDRNAQVRVRLPGVTGLVPGLAVRLQMDPQPGDVVVAHAHEDREPEPADLGERLVRVRGHPDRRMRDLVRHRRHRHVLEPVEGARVAEWPALPCLADDLEGLEEAGLALAVRDPQHVVGARGPAAPDPELEAPLAELVHRRRLFGDAQGVAERKDLHGDAHAHAPGPGGDEARQRQRSRLHRPGPVEVDLAEPHAVEAPGLGRAHQLDRFPECRRLAGSRAPLFEEDPDVHLVPVSSRRERVRARSCGADGPRVRPGGVTERSSVRSTGSLKRSGSHRDTCTRHFSPPHQATVPYAARDGVSTSRR